MTHFEHLQYYVPDLAKRRILDVGSGSGRFLLEAARKGATAVGLEYNPANVEKTLQQAVAEGLSVDVRQGAAEHLPYADNSFDFVDACEVIEHVESPELLLGEAARVLEADGLMYLSVPNRFGFKDQHFHLAFINWMPRRLAHAIVGALGKHKDYRGQSGRQALTAMHYYTYRGACRLARAHGFVATDLRLVKLRRRYPRAWVLAAPLYLALRTAYFDSFHLLLKKPSCRKLLIVQTNKLGDMICTTPVFRAVARAYPDAAVVVAGSALNGEVLAGNPNISEYWNMRTMSVAQVRAMAFDAAVLLSPNPAILRVLQKARIPLIVVPKVVGGYSPYMTKTFRFWSLFAMRVPHRMGHYAPQEYLNMLAPLGIVANDTRKELFVSEEAQAAADALLAPHKMAVKIAIAPGAGNKIKEWPPERFGEVAGALAKKHDALIVLVGGPADQALAEVVKKHLPPEHVLDTTGTLSIEELKGLVRRMDLFVSADTGPIYVAEAFDVPTVDIVGPMDEREQPPKSARHHVVIAARQAPAIHIMNARMYDIAEARRQVEAITAAEVRASASELLART